jgi:hypothetical protein
VSPNKFLDPMGSAPFSPPPRSRSDQMKAGDLGVSKDPENKSSPTLQALSDFPSVGQYHTLCSAPKSVQGDVLYASRFWRWQSVSQLLENAKIALE